MASEKASSPSGSAFPRRKYVEPPGSCLGSWGFEKGLVVSEVRGPTTLGRTPVKKTKQGLPDLNRPRNGKKETKTGDPQPKQKIHGVCEHQFTVEVDEDYGEEYWSCRLCGEPKGGWR